MIDCIHWSPCAVENGGCCAKNLFGGKPSRGICQHVCSQRTPGNAASPAAPSDDWLARGPGQIATLQPIPREKWPAWAKFVAMAWRDGDVGIGDTVKRNLGIAGELFKAAMLAAGAPCGCADREIEWNRLYQYKVDK